MPKIFRQKDIDKMQASDVNQEFIDYYNRLSQSKKEEFAKQYPDLFAAIQSWENKNPNTSESDVQDNDMQPEEIVETRSDDSLEIPEEPKASNPSFDEISHNYYEEIDIPEAIKNGLDIIEALTIHDNQTRCPVHRTPFVRYNPKFHTPDRRTTGMYLYFCPDCNRLYIKESRYDENIDKLTECDISHNIYDVELSTRYLKSITEPYALNENEKIYIPRQWIEKNPRCEIHDCALEELPCIIKNGSRSFSFDAYYCCECDKVILRKAAAQELEDKCAEIGIPLAGFEPLEVKLPKAEPIRGREFFPDFEIYNGVRKRFNGSVSNCYQLVESDTVVVSDSIYCAIEGHSTKQEFGLIWVKGKRNGNRKSYLFSLGYCSDCEKFYMEEQDYKTLYNLGRPEVTILLDVDEDQYNITSGEVFDLENKHLGDLEENIDGEVADIKNKPDYVGQYDTQSGYDDGGLAAAKAESLRKYEPRLQELFGYEDCPYEYRVDISCDDKSEVYYIGTADIILKDNQHVISANSKFGGKLVNIGTTKIEKDGLEYSIKLTRQFDINNAALYGYENIRTADDIIFRNGITDPFLVRVLKKRKQQHNLVDIFVTIQENQNSIVDADFGKNIIVQGCAGSGKTMVLLHRLSSLNYNRPDFDFVQNAIILTPNDNFTTHINGLASSLQIGAVERLSVEKYYARILSEYSKDMAPTGPISSEMIVDQKLVDYIYSDDFKVSFDAAYQEILSKRNALIEPLHDAEALMGEEIRDINTGIDSNVIPELSRAAAHLSTRISDSDKNITSAQKSLNALYDEKRKMEAELPKKQSSLSLNLRRLAANSKTKGLAALVTSQKNIEAAKAKLDDTNTAKEKLETEIAAFTFVPEISSLDNFKESHLSWIDSSITDKSRLLIQKQERRWSKESENTYAKYILETPLEVLLESKSSEDAELNVLLKKLSDERDKHSNLILEREKLEKTWLTFGKVKKTTDLNSQIQVSEDIIKAHEASISELYDKRRKQYADSSAEIEKLTTDIQTISREIQGSVLENMKKKLTSLKSNSTRQSNALEVDNRVLEKRVALVDSFSDGMADSDILVWLNDISEFAPDVRNDIQIYNRQKRELSELETSYPEMDSKIETAKSYYDGLFESRYPDEIKKKVATLNKEISLYSDYGTFKMIIEKALSKFKEENHIKMVAGKYHRYDLYAQLIFAMKFYKKLPTPIKFMCIDEGQDLAPNEYRLIKELNANRIIFNIFGDTNQLIKPNRGIGDWSVLDELFETKQFILNENYRNTNQITRFCNDSFGMSMLQTGVDGPRVRELSNREFEYELGGLRIIPNERLAILIPRRFEKKKWLDSVLGDTKLISETIEPEKIALMYVDEVKGIEFDKVYVIPEGMAENEKYIAYTRALNELIIVITHAISIQENEGI